MTARRAALSTYERQLKPSDAMASFLFMGTNTSAAWTVGDGTYDLNYFPATYTLPLMPPVAVSTGARGNSIVANAPKRCVRKWQFNVFDYDQELLDQFQDWIFGGTELKVYAFGDFEVVGYIGSIPLKRPRSQSLLLEFLPTRVSVVKSTITDDGLMDFSTTHHSWDVVNFVPFLQTYGVSN